ncbi:MAG TPA: hypothetical protein VG815_18825, partial [Chloroflexota bacterium]|nr:hypothetical protein [Chloroflexota bacterium]
TSSPDQANADFLGVAVHCAKGNALCAAAHGGVADKLPNEPGAYSGFNALYGNKTVAPQISPGGPVKDLNGQVITDGSGHIGFPAITFDPLAAQSLAYVADMQEHGIPVTYAYIADAHDLHTAAGGTYGPGQAAYVAQLKSYDKAFGTFFANLAAHGINRSNTLFMFTADEGDHFVGGPPSPAGCDGITTACTYKQIGEIDGNLTGLLKTEAGVTTPFKVHADSAPVFYVNGNPSPDSETVTRPLERAVGALTASNPITGGTDRLTNFLADPVEMKILHMITADPARTPTFTMFANPNYYLDTGAPACSSTSPCTSLEGPSGSSWNHGDVGPDIDRLWMGVVGPGVANIGQDARVWTDETDNRPTMMALVGLKDDYVPDGRVITEILARGVLSPAERLRLGLLERLGRIYKQIEAPVGRLGLETLVISTRSLESGNAANDSAFARTEKQLQALGSERDTLGAEIRSILNGAEFGGQSLQISKANLALHRGLALGARADRLAVTGRPRTRYSGRCPIRPRSRSARADWASIQTVRS